MQLDAQTIRTTLILTLVILLGVVIYKWLIRRFKESMPLPHQAWLMKLQVAYHPQRVSALIQVPESTEVGMAVLDEHQKELESWPAQPMTEGDHTIEQHLSLPDGTYFFRISTNGQSTLRRFSIKTN